MSNTNNSSIFDLDQLNKDELLRLKNAVEIALEKIEIKNFIDKVRHTVKLTGYYGCPLSKAVKIEGLSQWHTHLYVRLSTNDKRNFNDIENRGIDSNYENQPLWFYHLVYNYKHDGNNDDYEIPGSDEWEFGDWDDPARCHAATPVVIYYRSLMKPEPPPGERVASMCVIDTENSEIKWLDVNNNGLIQIDKNKACAFDEFYFPILEFGYEKIKAEIQKRNYVENENEDEIDNVSNAKRSKI